MVNQINGEKKISSFPQFRKHILLLSGYLTRWGHAWSSYFVPFSSQYLDPVQFFLALETYLQLLEASRMQNYFSLKKKEWSLQTRDWQREFKGLLPSIRGGGNSLRTSSIWLELSRLTIRATRPSNISPCTFMWSFDPATNWKVNTP